MDSRKSDTILALLGHFRVEIPSWGFANTGTRFGKFLQPAAATTAEANRFIRGTSFPRHRNDTPRASPPRLLRRKTLQVR